MINIIKDIISTIKDIIIGVVIIICGFFEAVYKVTIINVFVLLSLFNLVRVDVMVTPIKEDK